MLSMRRPTMACERTVRVSGMELFVRESGAGFPLLLINGIGANVEMWGSTERTLAAGSRTIAFDAPGTGRSTTPIFPLSIASLAQTARRVMDVLGHEQFDVLGFSFGGLIAQEVARSAPEQVRRLALVSTVCGWGSRLGDPAALSLLATPLRYYSRSYDSRTGHLYGPRDRGVNASIRNARLSSPPTAVGYAYQLFAAATWSSLSWLPTLQMPTLVVAGGEDRVTPVANGVQLARLIPDSRLHVLPTEGHLALFDPESGAPALLADFFTSSDLDASTAWEYGLPLGEAAVDELAA
jgi:pimeloyl-ACP methyl ester carboxylesterase